MTRRILSLVLASAAIAGCSSAAPSAEPNSAGSANVIGSGGDANSGGAGNASAAGGANGGARNTGGADNASGAGNANNANAGASALGGVEFAPYFPAWTFASKGYAYTSLTNLQQLSGIKAVTLAFVIAAPGAGCMSDLATDGIGANLADIHAFEAAGGHVKLSFGGADGLYLQDPTACANATDLAAAIGAVVEATGITDLDFDIEQPFNSGMSDTANQNLGQALHSLQQSKPIQVGLTLQHTLNGDGNASAGLDATAITLIGQVLAAGTTITHVNVMTMGYGALPASTTESARAIATLNAAQAQLKMLIPSLSDAQAWAMLGVTPEIGANDNTAEIFTADDATVIAQFAHDHQLGLASFWSMDRDRVCAGPCGFQKYSTVNSSNFQFAKAFTSVLQ